MYGIFTYIYHKNQPNVGKYTIHGWYGITQSAGCHPFQPGLLMPLGLGHPILEGHFFVDLWWFFRCSIKRSCLEKPNKQPFKGHEIVTYIFIYQVVS